MKLVIAVIKPFKLEEVREALTAIGVQGLMVSEVKGYGRQSGHTEIYRGAEYVVNFVPKVKLELVVPDAVLPAVVDALSTTAKTGKIGDGKIFVASGRAGDAGPHRRDRRRSPVTATRPDNHSRNQSMKLWKHAALDRRWRRSSPRRRSPRTPQPARRRRTRPRRWPRSSRTSTAATPPGC